jgi:predicted PurR-regulated permease PerM
MTTEPPIRTIRVTWRTAVLAVAAILAFLLLRGAFVAAHRVLSWTVAAVAVAVFVEPLVNWLGQWIPRVLAVVLTFLLSAAAAGLLVFGTVDDLDSEIARLRDATPAAIEDLESRNDEIGRVASEIDLSTRSDTFLDALDERIGSGSGALAENAPTIPVYFVSAILAIFLLVYGPAIATGAIEELSGDRRDTVLAVLTSAAKRARRTVAALLGQGAVIGVVTFLFAWSIDLPAPIVLGLLAGVAAMLPDVGILLGTFPTVALTAGFEGVAIAAGLLVAVLVVQLFEAFYLRRRIRDIGVDVGPAVMWIVALVGFTIYGPGMAVFGVAYAIFALAVIDQVPNARDAE